MSDQKLGSREFMYGFLEGPAEPQVWTLPELGHEAGVAVLAEVLDVEAVA